MTDKQVQELIERVEYADVHEVDDASLLWDIIDDCKTALQEYQEVMDRVDSIKLEQEYFNGFHKDQLPLNNILTAIKAYIKEG